MDWLLFLDDERYPSQDFVETNWRIARSVDDAIYYVKTYGLPKSMSLDHDLGSMKLNGKDFCNWIVNYCLDHNQQIPLYYVHSQNSVGAENMRKYLIQGSVIVDENYFYQRGVQDQQAVENHLSGQSKHYGL